jgi:alginate O-acetyltransferase complex protein AlgI
LRAERRGPELAFNDASFLAFVTGAGLLFHVLPVPFWRRGVLLGASAAFLASFGPAAALAPVLGFGGVCTLTILAVAYRPRGAIAALIALVVLFALLRGYLPFWDPPEAAATIGMSYILFRTLQVVMDLRDDLLRPEDVAPVDIALFLFSFLTLGAGPIQRYEEFTAQLARSERLRLREVDPRAVFGRAAGGFVKLIVLAPWVNAAYDEVVRAPWPPGFRLGIAAALFLLWIYVNFSGYMDVVIGLGRLFGFGLPENFDRPDRTTSFLDLWSRWHITLSRTFLTYMFNPLVATMLRRRWVSGPIAAGAVSYLVVFTLVGWWHGTNDKFALMGFLFGVAAAVNKLWQAARQRWSVLSARLPFGATIAGGIALGACAIAAVPSWPVFPSVGEALAAFSSPSGAALAFLIACGAGCLARALGQLVDVIAAPTARSTILRAATSPVVLGLVAALLGAMTLTRSVDIPAIAYYQRF